MIPAQAAIPGVLVEILRNAPLTPEKVSFAWRVAVGPAIDRISSVKLGDGGVLLVIISDTRWPTAIERSSPLILQRLTSLLGPGVVTRIQTAASQ